MEYQNHLIRKRSLLKAKSAKRIKEFNDINHENEKLFLRLSNIGNKTRKSDIRKTTIGFVGFQNRDDATS